MRVLLAPMEGVIDHTMRDLLTRLGGYDRCVTEFIRLSQYPLPGKVFRRFAPELDHGGRTPAGVPVFVLAQQYGRFELHVSSVIVLSTLLSLFSLTGLLLLYEHLLLT